MCYTTDIYIREVHMKNKAIKRVLDHNNLNQTVTIVTLLLEGLSQSEVARAVGVSGQWVYKVNKKYLKLKEEE